MIMKNQLLNLKMIALMCLMMVLGGANVWAQDVTLLTKNYTWNVDDSKSVSQTVSGVTFSFVGGSSAPHYYDDGLRTYEGCKVSISSDDDISKIVFTYSVNNDGILKDPTSGSWNVVSKTWTGSTKSVSLTVGHSKGRKKGQVRLTKIVVTKVQSKTLTSLVISGQPTKKIYDLGEALNPAGLVVTGTYDDKSTATITDGITWAMNPATLSLNDVSCSVTATVDGVTSPAYNVTGLTVNEAKVPSVIFYESFDKNDGTGGNDGLWSNDIAKNTLKLDNTEWTCLYGNGAQKCARFGGSSNKKGVATTPSIDLSAGDAVLAFKAGAWNTKSEKTSIIVSVDNGKLAYNGKVASEQTITLKKGEFSDYTMTISGGTSATKITFSAIQASNNRFFLDEVMVSKATVAEPTYTAQNLKFIAKTSEGYYATFSSDKVTFITSKHVIPHVVTVANGKVDMKSEMFKSEKTTIESAEVYGYYIPANTGILLYSDAENADYYTVENKTVDALAEGTNMLMPAPVAGGEFTADTDYKYYKLAYNDYKAQTGLGFYWGAENGGAFKVKAGTAYLAVPASDSPAKGFAFNGEATGIDGVNANVENAKAIYNLNGQRVASMAKPGLYIVNGKKVVRK